MLRVIPKRKRARDTETQARARYQAGLATIVEVSEAICRILRLFRD